MSQGARNWPFLTLTTPAGLGGRDQQVGLAAQERRNLQHVDDLGHGRALARFMHVGQHGQAGPLADFGKDGQGGFEPHATLAARAGPVGLVEGGLEDDADAKRGRYFLEGKCHFERVVAALHLAGARDQRQRLGVAEADRLSEIGADGHDGICGHEKGPGWREGRRAYVAQAARVKQEALPKSSARLRQTHWRSGAEVCKFQREALSRCKCRITD